MPIVRVDRWPEPLLDNDYAAVGHVGWTRLIPAIHRALANPQERVDFPRFTGAEAPILACAYWETAVYVMRRLIGWNDLGAALAWWYRQDWATFNDPRLALLRELWNDKDQLCLLALWAWANGNQQLRLGDRMTRDPRDFMGPAFFERFLQRFPSYGETYAHDPYWGGDNPLHLGHSLEGGGNRPLAFELYHQLTAPSSVRSAVLVVDDAATWHSALVHGGKQLASVSRGSWRIDVFAKPIGWLGEFRKSRITGEWYQGSHAVHAGWRSSSKAVASH